MAPTPSRGGGGGGVREVLYYVSDRCRLRCVAAVAMRDLQPTLGPADAITKARSRPSNFNNAVASNRS